MSQPLESVPVRKQAASTQEIIYPDSDGKRMADSTEHFNWIVKIKEGLEVAFADRPDVFVAGDLLWYPVEGNNKIRNAPDAMVAFGRPKGDRGSYRQWEEGNIAPQVVFEILSHKSTPEEMKEKFEFYERYGAEEYYLYDFERAVFRGWTRSGEQLQPVPETQGWVSPRLEMRFEIIEGKLDIFRPGEKFMSPLETGLKLKQERLRRQMAEVKIEQAKAKAEQERQRADQAETELEKERQRAEMLEAKLKALGLL